MTSDEYINRMDEIISRLRAMKKEAQDEKSSFLEATPQGFEAPDEIRGIFAKPAKRAQDALKRDWVGFRAQRLQQERRIQQLKTHSTKRTKPKSRKVSPQT